MAVHVYIPTQFVSRYSLLGAFASELGDAFSRAGAVVNADRHPADERGIFLLFNTPERVENIKAWIESIVGELAHAAVLHYHVDHPFALHAPHIDVLSKWPTYRLLLPCRDDAHILRLRWPSMKHISCPHGVPRSALCYADSISSEFTQPQMEGARPVPLMLAGTIHSDDQLAEMTAALPQPLREVSETVASLLASRPHMTFTQAFDIALPPGMLSPDHWRLMEVIWRCATAAANTRRRVRIASAMQGIPTAIYGPPAWEPHCRGTLAYAGEAEYAALPGLFRQARVTVAWGPTQFAHTYSERLLLAFAAGCATVTDDRLMSRAQFGEESAGSPLCLFEDAANPEAIREAVDALLGDGEAAAEMACRGRACVETAHLWDHRLDTFAAAAADCWR
jgi:hypothetical protein